MPEFIVEILDEQEASKTQTSSETILEVVVGAAVSTSQVRNTEITEVIALGPQGPPGPQDLSGLAFILYDGANYAARNTVTSSTTRPVVWIGPVAPAINATFALNNVDLWWNTAG